ncbi:MAG TPA: aminoglycoside adenylyltransferase domain-containing protein [Ilumatobacteraceae bacterium]|nr:aminoglycoside adenylyltransferase domain-containing protein [Ilumatobacteraceae bacterium]
MAAPEPPRRWPDVDDDLARYLSGEVVAALGDVLGDQLAAVVLHGSLVFGDWRRPVSDIDLLVLTHDPVPVDHRPAVARAVLDLSDRRPVPGPLELSVLSAAAAAAPRHPVRYEVHASEMHREAILAGRPGPTLGGLDADLCAHLAVARAHGVSLVGPPPTDLIGEVTHGDLLDSVQADLDEVLSTGLFEPRPVYGVLSACRALATILGRPGTLLSKEQAGAWGLERLPAAHRPLVEWALAARRGEVEGDAPFDYEARVRFRTFVVGAGVRRRHGRRVPGLP